MQRIRYYAELCGLELPENSGFEDISRALAYRIYDHLCNKKNIESLFNNNGANELTNTHLAFFRLILTKELVLPNADGDSYYKAFNHIIDTEYKELQETANRFRIACFGETPFSMLMWAHYANKHQGFCIEYETPVLDEKNIEIYSNLFPIIYTDSRNDLANVSLRWCATGELSNQDLWDFYKYGLLCKSIDWKYQQEWRLISYDNLLTDEYSNCTFFKIKKVYLGNRMGKEDRKEIISICKDKGIPYTGVVIAPEKFAMAECNNLCENCYRLKCKQ